MSLQKVSFLVLALAVLMMGIGIYQGEAAVVLNKGINLCLECVGIG